MASRARLLRQAITRHWPRWWAVSAGFVVLYQGGLLLITMARFRQVPNYVDLTNLVDSYRLIIHSTPAWSDIWPILLDEPFLELGFKDPHYYGVATWSYMLIPPKLVVVWLAGALLATILALARNRQAVCSASPARAYALAALGSGFVGLSSVTLTWVVCCATPSWVVALTMLGMSASFALWLTPFGALLTGAGLLLLLAVVVVQVRQLPAAQAEGEVRR